MKRKDKGLPLPPGEPTEFQPRLTPEGLDMMRKIIVRKALARLRAAQSKPQ